MSHSFQAKLIWAHQHMEALRWDILAFARLEPYVVVHEFHPERSKHIWRVDGPLLIPPQQISLRLGDTLYNYRGVLDHLIWDLVLASGGIPTEITAFPICGTLKQWKSARVQRQIAGIHEDLVARIEALQPYNGRYPDSPNEILGLLNRLGNVEKHRHFNLIAAAVELACFTVDTDALAYSFIHKGPVEDDTVLAIAEGKVDVDFIPAPGVAFGQGGDAPGKLVNELMLLIEFAVEGVLGDLAWFALKH